MKDRLSAVAEETLLTLAPLDLEGRHDNDDDTEETRRLVVLASSEGPVADLEFIGGGDEEPGGPHPATAAARRGEPHRE